MEDKKKKTAEMFRRARQIAEMNDYIHSERCDINNKFTDADFIKLVREYAIQKKGYSVFDEMSESEKVAD